jgi:polar amino acid transport system ATP-binding protein
MSMSGGLAPDEPMVRFQEVTKRYGALTVLDKLDLDVALGEKVAVIGPSGSGKTTVLRMLMTLERIDGGVIWVDGEPLTHMPQNDQLVPASQAHLRRVRAKIGMVFQHFNLFPHMSALANCMEAPLHVLGLSKAEARPPEELFGNPSNERTRQFLSAVLEAG